MTLLETERLARKLAAAVNQTPESATALKLAEDFTAACRAANLRLRQCEAMLNSGDAAQALQLAETAPNLMDLITRLDFRESDAWRSYCYANRLPAAESLDERAVQRLNEAYTKGISTEDPLYRRYRKAVLMKNDDEARAALRSIARLNPSDTNAASELARLDGKVLAEKLAVLGRAVETATPAQVAHLSEIIEGGGFLTAPTGEQWRRAQKVRATYLLEMAEKARHAEDWRTALSHLELIQHIQAECEFNLSPQEQSQFSPLKQWADAGLKRHLQDQEFSEHLSELARLLGVNEEKDTMARAVPLGEMKSDYEGLHRVWRSIQELARPVPDELNNRFRRRSSLLEAEISRRTKRRVQAVVAAAAVILVIGGLAVWIGLAQFRARDFANQLAEAEKTRQLRAAQKLIEHINTQEKKLLGVGALPASIAKAETFVTHERELLKSFEDSFTQLPQNPAPGLSAAQIISTQKQFDETKSLFDRISPDVRTEQQPRFAAIQNKWEKILVGEAATVNSGYEKNLYILERDAAKLDYRADLKSTRQLLATLAPILSGLHDSETRFSTNITVRADLRQRRELAEAKVKPFFLQIQNLDDALKQLQTAKVFSEFASAMEKLSRSELSVLPVVSIAKERRVSELSDEALLQALLINGSGALAQYFKTYSEDNFIPSAAMPAEVNLADSIQNAINMGAQMRRYVLTLGSPKNQNLEWITLGPLLENTGWTKIHAYEPAISPDELFLTQRDVGYFDGKYRLSGQQPIDSVRDAGACRETIGASRWKFDFPKTGESYQKARLLTLDQLNQDTNCSPLFRAFVFMKIVDAMELQPEAWGIAFCPAARFHRNELRTLAGEIKDGDWYAPGANARLAEPLSKFFRTAEQISYWKQAQGLATLARKTWESGITLAGYVDAEGKVQLASGSNPFELWGFDHENAPALLYRSTNGKLSSLRKPLPLSPLFSLTQPRNDLLAQASIDPKDKLFSGHLPPLFADMAEIK